MQIINRTQGCRQAYCLINWLVVCVCLCVFFLANAHADEDPPSDEAVLLAAEIYALSGLEDMVKAVPQATVRSFEEALQSRAVPQLMAEIVPSELLSAVSTAFNATDLSRSIVRAIAAQMSEVQMMELSEWYRSPLGEKVVQAETTYSQLLHPDRFIEFQNELRKIPPSEARYAAVKSLDDAMSVTKSAVDTMLNMQLAFTLSIMQAVPVEDQVPAAQIIEQTEAQRPLLYEHYQQMSSESILFTYQNFTLEELGELRAVMEQPAGKQFVHAINEGLEIGIFDASATLGELIVQLHHYQQSAI